MGMKGEEVKGFWNQFCEKCRESGIDEATDAAYLKWSKSFAVSKRGRLARLGATQGAEGADSSLRSE